MKNKRKLKLEDINIYNTGICSLSACVPKGYNIKDITKGINALAPLNVNTWEKSEESFSSGHSNPCECQKDVTREHYLFIS